jgi:hypothetical protein
VVELNDDVYAALDSGLGFTEDPADALFVDRQGRMRTDPSRKPPPGGTPAHLAALLEVAALATLDEPLYAALDAGMLRVRHVNTGGRAYLSLTASVAITSAQRQGLESLLASTGVTSVEGRFAGEAVMSIGELPVED